jgi:hypothetical protein
VLKFLLLLYFSVDALEESLPDEDFSAIADNCIKKMLEMPAIPRVGEYIDMGDTFCVESVHYDIKKRVIEVRCEVGLFTGVIAFCQDKEGWDTEHLNTGKELFYQRVKEFEERQKNNQKI